MKPVRKGDIVVRVHVMVKARPVRLGDSLNITPAVVAEKVNHALEGMGELEAHVCADEVRVLLVFHNPHGNAHREYERENCDK